MRVDVRGKRRERNVDRFVGAVAAHGGAVAGFAEFIDAFERLIGLTLFDQGRQTVQVVAHVMTENRELASGLAPGFELFDGRAVAGREHPALALGDFLCLVCAKVDGKKHKVEGVEGEGQKLNGFSVSCHKNGFVPGAQLLRREVVSVPEGEREFFGDEVEELIAIDRIRTADGSPIMVEYNLFPRAGLEFLETEPLGDASLFKLIRERTDRRAFRGSEQSLGIQLANDELAKLLEVPLAEPLFNLRGRYRDQFNKPLYVGQQYIIGSRYTFSM